MLRIDKFLSDMGKGTRKEVTKYIKSGEVTVNGIVIKNSSDKVSIEDKITLFGEEVFYKKNFYIMMNKPQNVVTATEDNFYETVIDLIEDPLIRKRVSPAGRLDIDTEGFVFLTDDGELNHRLTGPSHHVSKKYLVKHINKLSCDDVYKLENGIKLDDKFTTKKAKVEIISDNECYLTICEGKFHQVKRMFHAVDNEVLYLKRVKIGGLSLDPLLEPGQSRELTTEELELLTIELKG